MANFFGLTIVIIVFIVVSLNAELGGGRGGLGDSKPADERVSQLVDRFKEEILKRICDEGKGTCPALDAKINVNSYKKQIVSGVNYFISATVGDETYHIKIFSKVWTNTHRLKSIQGPKQPTDEITSFV